ncbi:TIGR01777 family oxidoreductase [Streptomyces sp. ISL-94]|uniref:TIGR01777 family oxidoreductase n=1 Tax=Streptomyces sp. ISL-94 TaxID=2819190 RepID=UPI001BE88151|nr:TIGR01777 family oxidoreductase [Streptomyces sp. ISL-94]MBT2478352.1 TIGR01777 family oxidoreductase [Streptomyces sp. ISL-94]
MRIAVTGSSGLIGSALVRSLRGDGHEVVRFVRGAPAGADEARWDPAGGYVDAGALAGCGAVVHLAGAGVGDHRWTAAYKKEIRDSRVLGTAAMARALAALEQPPQVFVVGSAVGYYGDAGDRALDEDSPAGDGFLAEVCVEWEAAAEPARAAGIRTAFARTGLVVARDGGAWGRMFPLFRAGLGGRLGNGRQYWPYISLRDEIAALRHIIDTPSVSGPVNLTGPEPLTNRQITAAMARVLHRPAVLPVPAAALRIVLGEFASDVLGSQRARPTRLLESGFVFQDPGVEQAIRASLRTG